MKYSLIIIFISIIIIISSCSILYSQGYETSNFNLKSLSEKKELILKEKHFKNTLKDFPFQFGISGGAPIPFNSKNYFAYGFFASLNINLANYKYFLKFEYGKLGLNSNFGGNTSYLFGGFSLYLFNIIKNEIFLEIGMGNYKAGNYLVSSGSIGVKFLFPFKNIINLIANLKLPIIRGSYYDQYYYNPFITIGIQFF